MSDSDFPDTVREATKFRANGACEWCGRKVDRPDLHHRLFRSRGGGPSGSNAVALCRECHGAAHGRLEGDYDAAVAAGISIPGGVDPATVPMLNRMFGLEMWILPNGDFVFADPDLQ